jgi:hypothetical protein
MPGDRKRIASHRLAMRGGSLDRGKIDRPLAARSLRRARSELGAERTATACRAIAATPGAGNDVDGDGRDRSSRSATIGGDDFSILAARARKGSRLVGDDELLEAPDTMGEEEEGRW